MDPVITFYSVITIGRLLAPVVKEGWKKLTKADAKEEEKRVRKSNEDLSAKLMLQRESHKDRLEAAAISHKNSMEMWATKEYYERCWPLRNPFEMQICKPISDDSTYFGNTTIVPCRLISALKDNEHPYAQTINGNLSSFIVNYYSTNSIHAVVSEIGAWKEEAPNNDASINYLYAGLKKQPVMVIAPTLVNDGKTFIFKAWSWGLGEELNYPAGFEFGRLNLKPLYLNTVYNETLKMVMLGRTLGQNAKFFSLKLQHNMSVIKEIKDKNLTGKNKEKMLGFLTGAPEIDDVVKEQMESIVSGIFCCMAGMYADAYHLLEYKTLPKLPSLLTKIPGIEYMLPSLRDFYTELLTRFNEIESDKDFLARLYLDIADSFSQLPFSFENQEAIISPVVIKALGHYIQSKEPEFLDEEMEQELDNPEIVKSKIRMDYKYDSFVEKTNEILQRSNLDTI